MYVYIRNGKIVETIGNIRKAFPNTSFPADLPTKYQDPKTKKIWTKVEDAGAYAPAGKVFKEKTPVLRDGAPTMQYVFRNKTADEKQSDFERERQVAYPNVGDQLDAIWKELNARRLAGEDLTQDADDMLGKILTVKKTIEKPDGV